jgi:hypothetical protein
MSASPQRRKSPRNQTAIGTGRSVSALLRAVPKMEAPAPVPPTPAAADKKKINPSLGRKSAPPQMVGLFFLSRSVLLESAPSAHLTNPQLVINSGRPPPVLRALNNR